MNNEDDIENIRNNRTNKTQLKNKYGKFKHHQEEVLHKLIEREDKDYNSNTKVQIQIIYIISAIIWIIIIYIFSLYCNGVTILLLSFIPIIVYGLNFMWAKHQSLEVSTLMFNADFLSIGFLIVTIILNWYKEVDKKEIFLLVVVSLLILSLGIIDIWTPKESIILLQNIRSVLETGSVVLLMIVVIKYYFLVQKEIYFD
uniref:Transmembrane protein n=1 Tax=Pithovirus LCPAC102 TaxID=2506587 RepID=A0A481Z535_9VIRU|nr:MAG: hypothetical protein LCPAC102_00290 [Pithovirus LCPAC102]